ncbi:MAG: PadR family transcriptional regulator [Bacteroidota bacterium]
MNRASIGELEELILLSIASLIPEAYGYSIKTLILKKANRDINLSAIHASLHRLEKKGLVRSRFGEVSKKRGGKRKKYFDLTAIGKTAIQESREVRNSFWSLISPSTLS